MSEELEKVKSIKYLPIFLWSDVLMPMQPTHKPVYFHKPQDVKMLADVLKDNKMFGVCYSENGEMPEVGGLGCVAQIKGAAKFKSGDSNVKFEGVIRFTIECYAHEQMNTPYPLAEVSFYEDYEEDEEMLWELSTESGRILQQIMRKSLEPYGVEAQTPVLRANPIPLSLTMQDLYSFDIETKLKFIASRSPSERLKLGCERLREFLDGVLDMNKRMDFIKPFPIKNKPDLG